MAGCDRSTTSQRSAALISRRRRLQTMRSSPMLWRRGRHLLGRRLQARAKGKAWCRRAAARPRVQRMIVQSVVAHPPSSILAARWLMGKRTVTEPMLIEILLLVNADPKRVSGISDLMSSSCFFVLPLSCRAAEQARCPRRRVCLIGRLSGIWGRRHGRQCGSAPLLGGGASLAR
jgi:hypothetical protein